MKVRGLLFDLDGTLVDHHGAVVDALRAWLPSLGAPPTPAALSLWDEIQERHLVAWRQRRITFAEQRRRRLRDFLPPETVLSVGDRHDLDVLPARRAGLRAVHLDRAGTGPDTEPERITSLRELRLTRRA